MFVTKIQVKENSDEKQNSGEKILEDKDRRLVLTWQDHEDSEKRKLVR